MKLRNTHEPFDEIEELHPDTIARLLRKTYVEVESDDKPANPRNERGVQRGVFGKKSEQPERPGQPPADLSKLADEISDEAAGA